MLRNNRKNSNGFTLLEVLVVISILILLLSLGLFASFDAYRSSLRRSEREVLVSALQKARSQAINNICFNGICTPHGVCYDQSNHAYIIFPAPYSAGAPTNESIVGNPSVTVSSTPSFLCGSGSGIVFSQLSGTTSSYTISVTQSSSTNIVTTNAEGLIDW
jgi:prepilin-type N-terminal cleavage/methylation domain-containing protein